MLSIGLVFLGLGAVASIACFFWRRSSEKTAGWWSSIAAVDIATALDAGDGIAVGVTGTVVGPDGLRDPVNDDACAWWRETVTEHWEERVEVTRSSNDRSSGPDHRWEERSNVVSTRASVTPFVLRDGAADLTITLDDLEIDDELLHTRAHRVEPTAAAAGEGLAATILAGLTAMTSDRRDHYVETVVATLPAGIPALAAGRMAGATLTADREHQLQLRKGTMAERVGETTRSAGRARLGLRIALATAAIGVVLSAVGAVVG